MSLRYSLRGRGDSWVSPAPLMRYVGAVEQVVKELAINYEWVPVESQPGQPYRYPQSVSRYVRSTYLRPAVYRWAVYSPDGEERSANIKPTPRAAYVGEAENLGARFQGYLRPCPSQQTNKRIKEYLDSALGKGSIIQFEVLKFEDFVIRTHHGKPERVSVTNLQVEYIRKMMENFALAIQDRVNCEILNRVLNPIERRRQKALRLQKDLEGMSPGEKAAYWSREFGLSESEKA